MKKVLLFLTFLALGVLSLKDERYRKGDWGLANNFWGSIAQGPLKQEFQQQAITNNNENNNINNNNNNVNSDKDVPEDSDDDEASTSLSSGDSRCTASRGVCTTGSCNGSFASGLCSGAANRRCCIPRTASAPNSVSRPAPVQQSSDRCGAAGGACTTSSCSGTFRAGLCPGSASNRCCIKGASNPNTPPSTNKNTPPVGGGGAQYIVANPLAYLGRAVGSGQCVALVQAYASPRLGVTATWRQGAKVRGNNLPVGTVIASGWVNGRYLSMPHGNHGAIYMGQNSQGIQVVDQWSGQVTHQRTIRWGGGSAANNGDMFYVVRT